MTQSPDLRVISPTGDGETDAALLQGIRRYLGRHEAINTIQLSGFVASDTFDEQTPVLVAMSGDTVSGVATVSPGFNLLLSNVEQDGAATALAQETVRRGIEIPGVMGPSAAALAFAEHWRRLTGGTFAPGMAQRILAATTIRPPDAVPGGWRLASDDDRALLIAWFGAFAAEVDHLSPERARQTGEAMMRRLAGRNGALLWLDQSGTPVSIACYKGPTLTGIRIGLVYTPPAHRRNGYAGAVTAAATQLLLDRGYAFACLYTDAANPTSNHIYEVIGYEFVADSMQYRFSTGAGS